MWWRRRKGTCHRLRQRARRKDSDEPVEWEGDDEVSSEEDGSEDEVRVSNAQRGRVRLHWASQSSTGLEVDDERRKSLGEKAGLGTPGGGGAWCGAEWRG